jgi:hypothetical protein
MPTRTTTKLKLCWVVRTAFSPGDRSDHRTCPVSPVNEIDFLCGFGVGLLVEVCVACAWWVVEKAMRPTCALRLEPCIRGNRNVGRRRAIASVGLYMAAMVTMVVCVNCVVQGMRRCDAERSSYDAGGGCSRGCRFHSCGVPIPGQEP